MRRLGNEMRFFFGLDRRAWTGSGHPSAEQVSTISKEYKIVIMGGGGVGKSAITVRFVHSLFVEKYDPTIEDSYRKTMVVDGITCHCDIMDTAGTEQFMALHSMYMKTGDGFVLVFSLSSMESVSELQNIREQVRVQTVRGQIGEWLLMRLICAREQIHRIKEAESRIRVPLVLCGNKCDLGAERQVPRDVAVGLSRAWGGVPYYETSARKEINIREVFEDIVRQMIKAGVGTKYKERGSRHSKRCVII
ncbi:BZ3500_MvSof-1268-A1-R1_Chr3-2g06296 [Microbotryum saponariae]|uniref:BZ3500_MvSof-1268-A1-R1_Chr3-2g06296 protein n=1 Tax=Microbotryum saponariae TaxID=289078 RepID=A0A2X0MZL4_9BASI|nr:BZ3500_MvSof-1268-A1-R1_Chr3-2g06296 [Microbotryum saponariae]SDA04267.1 BZ3501_MvSof-1269-A2-R1_Chr3-2g05987 [Microbotryum saponariae]